MTDHPLTNAKGRPIFNLLRAAGLPVSGVVVLGVFVHVECKCENTAKGVARLLSKGGFSFLKISRNYRRAAGYGSKAVDYWTAHLKV